MEAEHINDRDLEFLELFDFDENLDEPISLNAIDLM
jgi:hypothetical protein